MDKSREQILTEAIGGCWHETLRTEPYHDGATVHVCMCGERDIVDSDSFFPTWERIRQEISYSTPDGFVKLWGWARRQEWWVDFIVDYINTHEFLMTAINPDKFADAIASRLTPLAPPQAPKKISVMPPEEAVIRVMEPGARLDALVAERVMAANCQNSCCNRVLNYSTDIRDAWKVAETMRSRGWNCIVGICGCLPDEHSCRLETAARVIEVDASTIPEAIAKAALIAMT